MTLSKVLQGFFAKPLLLHLQALMQLSLIRHQLGPHRVFNIGNISPNASIGVHCGS